MNLNIYNDDIMSISSPYNENNLTHNLKLVRKKAKLNPNICNDDIMSRKQSDT